MLRGLLRTVRSKLWQLARPLLLAGGAMLIVMGLGAIAMPLVLGLTLLAAAQWATGESEEAMPTVAAG